MAHSRLIAGNRVVHDGLANLFGVERAERGDLLAVVEGAGVDEVRALAAGRPIQPPSMMSRKMASIAFPAFRLYRLLIGALPCVAG